VGCWGEGVKRVSGRGGERVEDCVCGKVSEGESGEC